MRRVLVTAPGDGHTSRRIHSLDASVEIRGARDLSNDRGGSEGNRWRWPWLFIGRRRCSDEGMTLAYLL